MCSSSCSFSSTCFSLLSSTRTRAPRRSRFTRGPSSTTCGPCCGSPSSRSRRASTAGCWGPTPSRPRQSTSPTRTWGRSPSTSTESTSCRRPPCRKTLQWPTYASSARRSSLSGTRHRRWRRRSSSSWRRHGPRGSTRCGPTRTMASPTPTSSTRATSCSLPSLSRASPSYSRSYRCRSSLAISPRRFARWRNAGSRTSPSTSSASPSAPCSSASSPVSTTTRSSSSGGPRSRRAQRPRRTRTRRRRRRGRTLSRAGTSPTILRCTTPPSVTSSTISDPTSSRPSATSRPCARAQRETRTGWRCSHPSRGLWARCTGRR
mmetsp:Transcript_37285/g.80776  ORF Transcript_37285/g.80776 Transcript_37285/m.80776 type:complete len:319 (-) Transcript_37285:255-1211(-)